ncbi:MAG: DNA primase [Wolbachia endosymbiont of Menacanthus eurysternus]|nr:MAG: DNA primase [Wolbachia endosymbiont of Menacanthus eurysternus]
MSYIDTIKSRLLISDIIGKKIKLIKSGNNFVGICPFHNEKTPSFFVNDIKGSYYCFGCFAHGDVFEFISQTESLSFQEVLKRLALVTGVDLFKSTDISAKNNKLFLALSLTTKWFIQKKKSVITYLNQRKISLKVIDKFKVGYAPYCGLREYLNSFGIEDEILIHIGLINKSFRDYFYNRLMFPIHDITGKVIGFGGRALSANQYPKYLNSSESKLFKKRKNLYGLDLALSEIRKKQHVFIVEGYMDVIALHQAGINNVVASLGTMISVEQIQSLWRFTKEISICMDGDNSGRYATTRIAKFILPILKLGYTLKFIILPKEKDPYDICNELEYKKEDILFCFNRYTELHSEYLWKYIVNSSNFQNYENSIPEKYSVLECRFMEYVNTISNSSIKRYYRDYFYTKISDLKKTRSLPIKIIETRYFYDKSSDAIEAEQNQAIILRIVIEFPEILNHAIFLEQFSYFEFTDIGMRKLQMYIIDLINNRNKFDRRVLLQELYQFDSKVIKLIFEKTNTLNSQLNEKKSAEIVWNNVILLKELNVLQKEKFKARLGGNFNLEKRLIEQIRQIEHSIQKIQMMFVKNR